MLVLCEVEIFHSLNYVPSQRHDKTEHSELQTNFRFRSSCRYNLLVSDKLVIEWKKKFTVKDLRLLTDNLQFGQLRFSLSLIYIWSHVFLFIVVIWYWLILVRCFLVQLTCWFGQTRRNLFVLCAVRCL